MEDINLNYQDYFKDLNAKDFKNCIFCKNDLSSVELNQSQHIYHCESCDCAAVFHKQLDESFRFFDLALYSFKIIIRVNNENFNFKKISMILPFSQINNILNRYGNGLLKDYIDKHIEKWKMLI